GVRVSARRRSPRWPGGYPYPARIEYGGGGVRAFLHPAIAAKEQEVRRHMEGVLDHIADEWST
ncbi:MAG: hypothetical protein AB1416_08240, partial [Actinomycetota bacterium]